VAGFGKRVATSYTLAVNVLDHDVESSNPLCNHQKQSATPVSNTYCIVWCCTINWVGVVGRTAATTTNLSNDLAKRGNQSSILGDLFNLLLVDAESSKKLRSIERSSRHGDGVAVLVWCWDEGERVRSLDEEEKPSAVKQ
jgi:hypothetical protein